MGQGKASRFRKRCYASIKQACSNPYAGVHEPNWSPKSWLLLTHKVQPRLLLLTPLVNDAHDPLRDESER